MIDKEFETQVDLSQHKFSLFGKDDFLKGEFILKNDTFVSARVEGTIRMEEKRKLIIEPSGEIIGKIEAHVVELYGRVDGEIEAKELLILYPNSLVEGRIKSKSVQVHPGARINGDCHTLN